MTDLCPDCGHPLGIACGGNHFNLNPIERLTRDLRQGAATLGDDEVRFIVDNYYIMQEDRKRSRAQERQLEKSGEPHSIITWLAQQSSTLEKQIASALDVYTTHHTMGSWMRGIYGIGPVISAGMLAHIDIEKAPTAGHIWSYAGLVNGVVWLGGKDAERVVNAVVNRTAKLQPQHLISVAKEMGADPKWLARRVYSVTHGESRAYMGLNRQTSDITYVKAVLGDTDFTLKDVVKAVSKRPWNEGLKTLSWKAGQSFMKFHNQPECFYGKLYIERKELEAMRNRAGEFKDIAAKRVKTVNRSTEAYKYYSEGVLPPGHLDARARRYAVKIFLSHMHNEWYRRHFHTEPPAPFSVGILGHAHIIDPPPPQ